MCSKVERSYQGRSRLRKHLFMDEIIETPLLVGWKNLSLNKYEGTTDPNKHINAYVSQGAALNWYTRLPPNSIDLFETLMMKFGAQYATSRPHHFTSIALVNL
ncbi:hypothetical protein CR513_58199, partial [Mucuna pruriens]